jgi:hypothetical protein
MNIPPLVLLADRGQFKAFEIEKTPSGSQTPRLVKSLQLQEAGQRYSEKFTDQAGSFPNGGTAGQGNSIAERMPLAAEEEMRGFRRLAGEIAEVLKSRQPERWAFAAPSEINGAILDGLPQEFRQSLTLNIRRDLVNTKDAELLSHFREGSDR